MEHLKEFRNELRVLEIRVSEAIWKIRGDYDIIPLFTEFDLEDYSSDFLEVRDDFNGGVYDVRILSVDTNGFKVLNSLEQEIEIVSLENFSSIVDRLNILEILTLAVEKINSFLETYCEEVYTMPFSELELKMDNHKCIKWGNKEYFISEEHYSDDEYIHNALLEYNRL